MNTRSSARAQSATGLFGGAVLAAVLVFAAQSLIAPSALGVTRALGASPKRAPALAQATPQNATLGIQPASATAPDGRTYFSISATPGATLTDYFAVRNYSVRPLKLSVRSADALNTAEGAFALLPQTQRNRAVGTWIELEARTTVVVPARRFVIVPFHLAIPRNAQPGDHAGGITVTLESFARTPSGQTFKLLQSVGSRVFIRVSGPLNPALSIEDLKVHYSGILYPFDRNPATVTYTVHNTGNVALGARQNIRISGLIQIGASASKMPQIDLLLPGSSVRQSVQVRGVVPQIWMTAKVSLQPLVLPGSAIPRLGPYTRSAHFWAVPWLLIAIIVFLIVIGLWIRKRRRRTPSLDKGAKPRSSAGDIHEELPSDQPPKATERAATAVEESAAQGTFTTPP